MDKSRQIELSAVNTIVDKFLNSDILSPYIAQGDKEPAWDGNIHIKKLDGSCDKIAAQVKGKIVKEIPSKPSYPVRLSYLQSYERDGGIAYFVVYIIGEVKTPYYVLLSPIELKKYIKLGQSQKTIKINLHPLNNLDTNELEVLFVNFKNDCIKQLSYIDFPTESLEDALKKGNTIVTNISGVSSKEEAFEYFLSHPVYLYSEYDKGDFKFLYPIGDQKYSIAIVEKFKIDILIDGKVFFKEYSRKKMENDCLVEIGKCITIKITKNGDKLNGKVTISRNATTVTQKIIELDIILSLTRCGYLDIGEHRILITKSEVQNTTFFEKEFKFWKRMENLFNKLHIDLNLCVSEFNKNDFKNLSGIADVILDNKPLKRTLKLAPIVTVEISNYSILLVSKKRNGEYLLQDFFEYPGWYRFSYKNEDTTESLPTSIFSVVFNREDLGSIINIDYSIMIKTYSDIYPKNHNITDRANYDMLLALKTYDSQNTKDEKLLDAASEISKWIIKTNNNDKNHIYNLVNKYQIIKRKREFNQEEKDTIADIILNDNNSDRSLVLASYLLLDNQLMAKKNFDKLESDKKALFQSMPIYHFWIENNK